MISITHSRLHCWSLSVVACFGIVLVGCVNDNRSIVRQYDEMYRPSWFDSNIDRDAQYVYASAVAREKTTDSEGEGVAFAEACTKLASKISVDVEYSINVILGTTHSSPSNHYAASKVSGSNSSSFSDLIAKQMLTHVIRKEVQRNRIEVNPSRFLNIHTGTTPSNLRWDVYVQVAIPIKQFDMLLERAEVPLQNEGRFLDAVRLLSGGSQTEIKEGVALLEQIVAVSPQNENAQLQLSIGYERLDRFHEASAILEGLCRSSNQSIRTQAKGRLRNIERLQGSRTRGVISNSNRLLTIGEIRFEDGVHEYGLLKSIEDELKQRRTIRTQSENAIVIEYVNFTKPEEVESLGNNQKEFQGSATLRCRWEGVGGRVLINVSVNEVSDTENRLKKQLLVLLAKEIRNEMEIEDIIG